MPEAIEYPTTAKAVKETDEAHAAEMKARGAAIKRAWDYYAGDHKLPLKVQQDGYDDNVIINDIEPFADKLESLLVGDGLQFDAGGDDETTGDDDDIAELWETNRGEILQSNLALSGILEGHIAVRLVPQDEGWPRIQHIKQAHFSAFWDPFDMSDVIWYRLEAKGRRIDYVRGVVDGDNIDPAAEGWTELTYRLVGAERDAIGITSHKWELQNVVYWPYDFPPIVDWQNLPAPNSYYGKADATSAIRLNDYINFIMSNLQRIVKYFAHPRTVGTGFTASDIVATAIGGLWTVENPEAKISNLEMTQDAALSRWLAEVINQALWQSGGLMDPQTMKDRVGQLTNFGLRVMFADAISRITKKQRLYAEAFEQIISNAFTLVGKTPPDTLAVIWPDVLPDDAEAEMRTLTAEFDRGLISKETYRDRRKYDNELEENRIADERATGDIGSQILNNLSFNRGQ